MGDEAPTGLDTLRQTNISSTQDESRMANDDEVSNGHTSRQHVDALGSISIIASSSTASLNNKVSESDPPPYDSDDEMIYQSGDEEAGILLPNEPPRPRTISQKKKIEQVNFRAWMSNKKTELNKKAVKHSTQQEQSIQYMVRSWEGGQKIITSPRDYQLELFERAKKENTIAVLDTGKPLTNQNVSSNTDCCCDQRIWKDSDCSTSY